MLRPAGAGRPAHEVARALATAGATRGCDENLKEASMGQALAPGLALGVDHIGVGASDVDRSIAFYAQLGFTDVVFDAELQLTGLDRLAGRPVVSARVALLRPARPTPLGLAAVKLVCTTDAPPPPMPEGIGWGEPGVCEVCVHVKNQAGLYRRLVDEHGVPGLMEPNEAPLPPHDTLCSLSYVADPDGTKIEMIEWHDLEEGWPIEDGPQGVNHVAYGVRDIERTRAFYAELGFPGMLFESDGFFEPMDPWYAPRTPPKQRMMLLTNPYGAGMEPVEHDPPSPSMKGEWGHLGSFEFAIGVRNIEQAAQGLRDAGIELLCEPQTIALPNGGSWSYAYFVDPDENYVALSESRF
jgi:catechol 2,3-dioxygenase-like lactoylglutathione lyase family enzyme